MSVKKESASLWCDDSIEDLHEKDVNSWCNDEDKAEAKCDKCKDKHETYNTPKKIYDYLNQRVWKQEEAKKAASVIAYNCLQGIKSNALFIGPSGCGKTYIWRCLKEIFPSRIAIVDGSRVSLDGWKGSTKWTDLFRSPVFRSGEDAILVIDEADKMLSPKSTSSGENVSHSVQAEGLTLMEGAFVNINDDSIVYTVDTSRISFVLCGAFSSKAHNLAEKSRGRSIGFGSAPDAVQAYEKPLEEADLIEFGVMPEFMGRIQRIVSLQPMTIDDYYRITESSCGFLDRIRQQYGADIKLSKKKRRELAEQACKTGLGIRGMENKIRQLIDDALFDDCERRCFEF